jgi:multisubunit Na+/H+ antiporter MnhE subunit
MSCRDPEQPRWVLVVLGGLVAFGALVGVWIALAGQPDEQDLVAGACAAAVCVLLGLVVGRAGQVLPSFTRRDLALVASLPKKVVVETAQVFAMAARKPFEAGGAVGTWSTVPVDTPPTAADGTGGWRAARRDAVLSALMSASPRTIVVEIDTGARTALIHSLGVPVAPTPRTPQQ